MLNDYRAELAMETVLIHGDASFNGTNSIHSPLFLTSTFEEKDFGNMELNSKIPRYPEFYTRYGNPSVNQTAHMIAGLEHAEACLLMGSGMGAISVTLLALLKSGDHIVAQNIQYGSAKEFMRDVLPTFGINVTFVNQENIEEYKNAIQLNTRILYCESPSNPTLQLTDLIKL